jgi:hypothetical protein
MRNLLQVDFSLCIFCDGYISVMDIYIYIYIYIYDLIVQQLHLFLSVFLSQLSYFNLIFSKVIMC